MTCVDQDSVARFSYRLALLHFTADMTLMTSLGFVCRDTDGNYKHDCDNPRIPQSCRRRPPYPQ